MISRILLVLLMACSLSSAAPKLLNQYDSTKKIWKNNAKIKLKSKT